MIEIPDLDMARCIIEQLLCELEEAEKKNQELCLENLSLLGQCEECERVYVDTMIDGTCSLCKR